MIFTRLSLTNFGLYRGNQSFDLKPQTNEDVYRPIVLFGGKNGAGKTTILEAIQLCLYGRETLGVRVEKEEYASYLLQKIHRQPGKTKQPTQARIVLEFENAHEGVRDLFTLERNWRVVPSGASIEENLIIQRNGKYLPGIDVDIWPEFIKDLIPPGVSQLFFFDGEKIQELAEDETGGIALAEAIKITFGLNLVENLKNDINVYTRRELDSKAAKELLEERAVYDKSVEELDLKLSYANRDRQDAEVELLRLENQLKKTKEALDREGGIFAERRNQAKARKDLLEGQISLLTKRIQTQLAEELMPFAAVPELLQELKGQLLIEEKYQKWQTSFELLQEHNTTLIQRISNPSFWQDFKNVPPDLISRISSRLKEEIDSSNTIPSDYETLNLIHGLSNSDRQQIFQLVDRSLTTTPQEINQAFSELQDLTIQLKNAEEQFNLAPGQEALQPLADKHLQLLELKIAQAQKRDQLVATVGTLLRERTALENKLLENDQKIRKNAGNSERLEVAGRVKRVIEAFYEQLMDSRINDLELALVRYFGQLSRKRRLVWKAKIDRATFQVTLFTRDGQQLPKSSLSAGEKQIYAIALLWALRDISGRPLPVIIDTPLGRLDSDHRNHIVENYLPFASHQVIVLSTDTEIDQTFFSALEPAISHSYHLHYDQEEMCTVVEEGYFWQTQSPKELDKEEQYSYEA